MKLEYVGRKPIISSRGVDFSIGKEDKYIYIEAAAQMLKFLGKSEINTAAVNISIDKVLDDKKVFKILYKYKPNFDKFYDKSISKYKQKIDDEISDIVKYQSLGDTEKEVLKKNLSYMQSYRLQRATNKLVYEELINACVDIIRHKGVTEITMPLSISFTHVASSFESSLARLSRAVVAKVEIMLDKDVPYTKLSIKGFGKV